MKYSLNMKVIVYSLTALVLFIWIFPIYWSAATSVKSNTELREGSPSLFPSDITLDHYKRVLFQSDYFNYLINSTVVGVCVVILTLALSCCTAFALSRLRFSGSNFVNSLIMLVYLFPGILLIIPLYKMMAMIGLDNNLFSLVLIHVVLTLPFATWNLKSFFDTIPEDLIHAALIDGASYMQILRHIYIPLILPGLAVVAIFSFVVSWSDYIFAVIMLSDNAIYTLPVGIAAWTSSYTIDWGSLTAASTLTILPAFIFFALLGRMFVRGLTAGATKG